jgi:hypothetical protein
MELPRPNTAGPVTATVPVPASTPPACANDTIVVSPSSSTVPPVSVNVPPIEDAPATVRLPAETVRLSMAPRLMLATLSSAPWLCVIVAAPGVATTTASPEPGRLGSEDQSAEISQSPPDAVHVTVLIGTSGPSDVEASR